MKLLLASSVIGTPTAADTLPMPPYGIDGNGKGLSQGRWSLFSAEPCTSSSQF